jgi:PKD repeat protein
MEVYGRIRFRQVAGFCLAFVMVAALAPSASALVVHNRHGHFFGLTLHQGVNAAAIPGLVVAARQSSFPPPSTSPSRPLSYHDGPVVHASVPYVVYWAPPGQSQYMPASWQQLMQQYFSDVAADSTKATNVFAVNRQFTDHTGFADYKQTFDPSTQVLTDTSPYPAGDSNCSKSSDAICIGDDQLQAEITSFLAAHPTLPNDGLASASQLPVEAPIYFFVLPTDVDVCLSGGGCASNSFCSYHSSYTDAGNNILYAAIPLNPLIDTRSEKTCQSDTYSVVQEPNGSPADVALRYISHEDSEAITDPLSTGWWDPVSGNEDGDNCDDYRANPNSFLPAFGFSPNLYDQVINGHKYYLQSEWSNGDSGCEMQPSPGTMTARLGVSAGPRAAGSPVTFDPSVSTSTNAYSSVTIDFGDGKPPFFASRPTLAPISRSYAAAGDYTVTLTLVDDRGNLTSTSEQITIGEDPAAAFTTSPSQVHASDTISFNAQRASGSGLTYEWDFGDGTPTATGVAQSHQYATDGTYLVRLTVTDGNGHVDTATSTIAVTPTAAFQITEPAPETGEPVGFDGSASNDPGGSISSYAWQFGDGAYASGVKPSHTYQSPGTYTVTLTVTDSAGEQATTTQSVTAAAGPVAAFTLAPGSPAPGATVTFNGTPSTPGAASSGITSYAWTLGDGATATGVTPSHAYSAPGVYTVTLTVTDSRGVTSAVSEPVTVVAPAAPAVTPPPDEAPTAAIALQTSRPVTGRSVVLSGGGSSDPDGSIRSYTWHFGDGASASGATASHTYARAGTYTVSLTVTDSSGQSATAVRSVTVLASGRITRVTITRHAGGATVRVFVSSAGTLTAGHRRFHFRRAGSVRFVITLTPTQLRTVARWHQLKVRIPLRFTPVNGPLATASAVISFRPARARARTGTRARPGASTTARRASTPDAR